MEAMVSRASSAETSGAMTASPSTWMWSVSPAARTASRSCRLYLPQAEVELVPGNDLLDRVVVAVELIADRRPDEIGAVGVEALPHQQVDMAEIDEAEIDGDLLAVGGLRPKLLYLGGHLCHPYTIHVDGIWSASTA